MGNLVGCCGKKQRKEVMAMPAGDDGSSPDRSPITEEVAALSEGSSTCPASSISLTTPSLTTNSLTTASLTTTSLTTTSTLNTTSLTTASRTTTFQTSADINPSPAAAETDNLSDINVTCGSGEGTSAYGRTTPVSDDSSGVAADDSFPSSLCGPAAPTDDEFCHPALESARKAKRTNRDWVPETPLEFLDCLWTHILKINAKNTKRRGRPAVVIVGVPGSRQALMRCVKLSGENWITYYPAECQPFSIINFSKQGGDLHVKQRLADCFQQACLRSGGQGCCCKNYFPKPSCPDEEFDRYSITGIPETRDEWERCYKALEMPDIRVSVSPLKATYMLMKISRVHADRICQSATSSCMAKGPEERSTKGDGDGNTEHAKKAASQRDDARKADEVKEGSEEADPDQPSVVNPGLDPGCVPETERAGWEWVTMTELGKDDVKNAEHVKKTILDEGGTQKTQPEKCTKTEDPDKEIAPKTVEKERGNKADVQTESTKKEESDPKEGTSKADGHQRLCLSIPQDPRDSVRTLGDTPKEEPLHSSVPQPLKSPTDSKFNLQLVQVVPLEQQYLSYPQRSKKVTKPKGAGPAKEAADDIPAEVPPAAQPTQRVPQPAPQPGAPAPQPGAPAPQPCVPAPQPTAPVPQPGAPVPQPAQQPAAPAQQPVALLTPPVALLPQPVALLPQPAPQPAALVQQPVPQPVAQPAAQPAALVPQPAPQAAALVQQPEPQPAPQPAALQ